MTLLTCMPSADMMDVDAGQASPARGSPPPESTPLTASSTPPPTVASGPLTTAASGPPPTVASGPPVTAASGPPPPTTARGRPTTARGCGTTSRGRPTAASSRPTTSTHALKGKAREVLPADSDSSNVIAETPKVTRK